MLTRPAVGVLAGTVYAATISGCVIFFERNVAAFCC